MAKAKHFDTFRGKKNNSNANEGGNETFGEIEGIVAQHRIDANQRVVKNWTHVYIRRKPWNTIPVVMGKKHILALRRIDTKMAKLCFCRITGIYGKPLTSSKLKNKYKDKQYTKRKFLGWVQRSLRTRLPFHRFRILQLTQRLFITKFLASFHSWLKKGRSTSLRSTPNPCRGLFFPSFSPFCKKIKPKRFLPFQERNIISWIRSGKQGRRASRQTNRVHVHVSHNQQVTCTCSSWK